YGLHLCQCLVGFTTQEWMRRRFCGAHGLITGGAADRRTVDAPANLRATPAHIEHQTKPASVDLDRPAFIERRVAMFSVAKQAQSPAATADRNRSCTSTTPSSDR